MVVGNNLIKNGRRCIEFAGGELLLAEGGLDLLQLLAHQLAEEVDSDAPSVVEDAFGMMNPLPDLGPGNFYGGGIFHQVVDGDATGATEPGVQVLQADTDIVAQTSFGDRAFGHFRQ